VEGNGFRQGNDDVQHTEVAQRLSLFRQELARRGLDGFVVPSSDQHQGEYVPPSARRLAWLTGFSGSAGAAVVLPDWAALFVDGRYTLQAGKEVDGTLFGLVHLVERPPHTWLAETASAGQRIGYDPWLHTPSEVDRLRQACDKAAADLIACPDNPLDAVWIDRPSPPTAPVVPHRLEFAGRSGADKRTALANELIGERLDAAVLSAPDSIAWLLNLRGGDLDFTPVVLCFALLKADASVDLFIDPRKVPPDLAGHLGQAVTTSPPEAFGPALDRLAGRTVRIDPATSPAWIVDRLTAVGARLDRGPDPCALPKACKNEVELEGARRAQRRDGVALVRFLAWLEGAAADGGLGEMAAAERLDLFRRDGDFYRGPSFPTISGAGPNGAIVHYRSTPETDRRLRAGELYLVDSGGQYLDGTTDVTRTVLVRGPRVAAGAEERRHFTLVLKGHIALASARFPKGTTGAQLDSLARRALWSQGLDYDHGTGHGVGSYLSVHEGPQRISKLPGPQALLAGMIVSDEPGYYKTDAYGIRIENLVAVRPWENARESPFLAFEVLTLAPIDLALVDVSLLGKGEAAWLNAYHERVRNSLTPLLDAATARWLAAATRGI
jgi:Xaa-Pro aminopeptidase